MLGARGLRKRGEAILSVVSFAQKDVQRSSFSGRWHTSVGGTRVRHDRASYSADPLDNTGKGFSAFLRIVDLDHMTWIPHQMDPVKAD
jgi:hypothetical protein